MTFKVVGENKKTLKVTFLICMVICYNYQKEVNSFRGNGFESKYYQPGYNTHNNHVCRCICKKSKYNK